MISFVRLDMDDMPWDRLRAFNDANIFQTRPWLDFLAKYEGAEPVVAAIQSDGQVMGYFMGLITKKLGLKILGSPFRSWHTYFMGFNLMSGISYHEVLQAFPKFVFKDLKCHYFEIIDVNLKDGDWRGLSYLVKKIEICTLDLTKSEAELFANMEGNNCRRAIRGAIKKGVVIEETNDLSFVDEYFAQHQAVMARKSLKPLYSLNFIRQMITHFLPTGNLLLLRAKNPDGVCIATHIDLVFNKVAVYWGGAGWPDYFRLHSSELIYWHSMMKVKSMGAEVLNLGPLVKKFKTKFGASTMPIFRLMKAKDPILNILVYFVLSIYIRARNWIRKD